MLCLIIGIQDFLPDAFDLTAATSLFHHGLLGNYVTHSTLHTLELDTRIASPNYQLSCMVSLMCLIDMA